MRHRSEPDEYRWSRISISMYDPNHDRVTLVKHQLGHASMIDRHTDYGDGLSIFIWDGTDERDDDGDLKGMYLTVRGVTTSFWREQAMFSGWLHVTHFGDAGSKVLVDADQRVQEWTHVRVNVSWWKEHE